MSKRLWIAAACLYAAMGVFTFGHSGAHSKGPGCLIYSGTVCTHRDIDATGMVAAISGLLWPFYWSWELQS